MLTWLIHNVSMLTRLTFKMIPCWPVSPSKWSHADLVHLQNDPMLNKTSQTPIRDFDITFDLFQYSNNWTQFILLKFCYLRWKKIQCYEENLRGSLISGLSLLRLMNKIFAQSSQLSTPFRILTCNATFYIYSNFPSSLCTVCYNQLILTTAWQHQAWAAHDKLGHDK